MDRKNPQKEKLASLEAQRSELLAVLKQISQIAPGVCRLNELEHQIMIYNLQHKFFDPVKDQVTGGPFFEVNFIASLKSYFEKAPKKSIVMFKHEEKTLSCLPKIVGDQLVIYFYEN